MKRLITLIVSLYFVMSPMAAFADSYTLDRGDNRLYVRVTTENITSGSIYWGPKSGAGSLYSGPVSSFSIYRGNIPISDENFISLLEQRNVAQNFVYRVRTSQEKHSMISWGVAIASLIGLGAVIFLADPSDSSDNMMYAALLVLSGTVSLISLPIALIGPPRQFNIDEAYDAVESYNSRMSR